MKRPISLSVIFPCYNEARNIRQNINYIYRHLEPRFADFVIIAVNDGSTDRTLDEIKKARAEDQLPIRIINHKKNGGKGSAVRSGILASKRDIVMFLDADLAIPIEEIEKFAAALDAGYDIAIASRFVGDLKILKPVLWYRRFMEKVFRILRMIVINNYDIQDTQFGFKMFKREAALKIFPLLQIKRFSFDVEVIFLAKKFGYKIKELPISLQNPQESHIRLVADSWNMFWDLFRIRWNDWKGRYKDLKHET